MRSMVDRVKTQMMTRFYNKRIEADTWPGEICPKIKKRLDKNQELANTCVVSGAGDGIFQVENHTRIYIVGMFTFL